MKSLLLSLSLTSLWIWASIDAFSVAPHQHSSQKLLEVQSPLFRSQTSLKKRAFTLPSSQSTTSSPQQHTQLQAKAAAASLNLNDDSNNHRTPSSLLWKAISFPRWMLHKLQHLFASSNNNKPQQLTLWKRRLLTTVCAVTLCFTTSFVALPTPPALANEPPVSTSLRPGMTNEQATLVNEGQLSRQELQGQFDFGSSTTTAPKEQQQQSAPTSLTEDAYDEFSDDIDLDDDDDWDSISTSATSSSMMSAPPAAASSSAMAAAANAPSSSFASNADHSARKQRMTQLQVGTLIFGPTFGGTLVREYIRRRREEAYVMKGLEIQKAQYAEYFNVTETTEDSDLEDELKGIKKNETSTDEDDDDDDEDSDDDDDDESDDDDDDEPDDDSSPRGSSRGGPKRPSPPGGNDGGGSSGGGSDDPGYGKPSDEDLDRLNSMFNKS